MPPAKANQRRAEQLEITQGAADRLETALRSISEKEEQCSSLADHISGFYQEVDKLTKGKTPFPATDLIVEQVNIIVRDAKNLIEGDPYLDRIKEFVPAGDNPVYPDVLMTTRVVQQAVGRCRSRLDTQKRKLTHRFREARTIVCALRFFVEAKSRVVTKEDVETMMDDPADAWFSLDDDSLDDDEHFDLTRLDNREIGEYLLEDLTVADGKD